MRILQVSQSFYPCFASGGVVRSVYDLSKQLVERGHDVTVYTTDGCNSMLEGNNHESIDVEGIKVFYLKNLSKKTMKFNISSPYYLPFKARKDLKNFDIIHIHEHRTVLAIIVTYFAKKNKIPYIVQSHGSLLTPQKKLFKKIFDYLCGYTILKNASNLIAVSKREIDEYKIMGVEDNRIKLVHNGIDLSEYNNLPGKGKFRKNYRTLNNNNERIILYLGRIHESKGIDLVILAFADLLKELQNVKLVIVGPDFGILLDLKKLIKELRINDKVLFTGPLYNREKTKAYVDADVFVSMRSDEIFGITFLEALACGTPIICSKEGGIANYINEIAGFSIDYNKETLKNKLIEILTNEKLLIKFEENGKLLVKEKFNLDNIINEFERIYLELNKTL